MNVYCYTGPVLQHGQVICNRFYGETMAATAEKARSNIAYQFKKKYGLVPNASITMPNKVERLT